MKWLLTITSVLLMLPACVDVDNAVTDVPVADECDPNDPLCAPEAGCYVPPPIPTMRDTCTGSDTTNWLLGTCWNERCYKGEKTLFPKPAGVNCVFVPDDAPNDEFVIGSCSDNGECGYWTPPPPPK